jgi:hypothetical protein
MRVPALWRRAFDAVEQPVARQLESAVQTERFADAVGLLVSARRAVDRRLERSSRRALHRANLPAASDLTRLSEQLAGLDRRMRELRVLLEEREGDADGGGGGARGPAGAGAARRRAQRPARAQRPEVRRRGGPAEGRADP